MYQLLDLVSWQNDLWFKRGIQKCSLPHALLLIIALQNLKSTECFIEEKRGISQKCPTTHSWKETMLKLYLKHYIFKELSLFCRHIFEKAEKTQTETISHGTSIEEKTIKERKDNNTHLNNFCNNSILCKCACLLFIGFYALLCCNKSGTSY